MERETYLVDMDGVSFDVETPFVRRLSKMFPWIKPVPWNEVTDYNIEKFYSPDVRHLLEEVWKSSGLFALCKPVKGALEAINEMAEKVDVRICTVPRWDNPTCVGDKVKVIRKYFGEKWTSRLIITDDKTLVYGKILIDDKPEVRGVRKPLWEHIIYDKPYNRNVNGQRRLNWANWKEVLKFDE